MTDDLPTAEEIIEVHDEISKSYGLTHTGIRAILPEQTLEQMIEEIDEYDDTYLRAAGLLRDLITAHIFEDGNKRTAWTVTRLYLQSRGTEPAVRETAHVAHVLRRVKRYDHNEIADWLATGTIDEDRLNP